MMAGRRFLMAASSALLLSGPAMADPEGTYVVNGSDPKTGNQYQGSIEIHRTGETYQLTWTIGGDVSSGVGIGSGEGPSGHTRLAVAFGSTASFGVAEYQLQPDGSWHGQWVYAGGTILATEILTNGDRTVVNGGGQSPKPARKPVTAP